MLTLLQKYKVIIFLGIFFSFRGFMLSCCIVATVCLSSRRSRININFPLKKKLKRKEKNFVLKYSKNIVREGSINVR